MSEHQRASLGAAGGAAGVAALQAALAGEHAAVYVDGVLGARASDPDLVARLRAAYDAHGAARDAIAERLHAHGVIPHGPAAAYAIPSGLTSEAALEAHAREIEQHLLALYVAQSSAATGADRRLLVDGAGQAAVRALGFGASPSPLPGLRT